MAEDVKYDREKMYSSSLHIYTEANPNPNSMKFVLSFMLMADGIQLDFPNIEETEKSPLAYALFENFKFIKRVFFSNNFITITKDKLSDWHEINPAVRQFLRDYIEAKKPVFADDLPDMKLEEDHDPENVKRMKQILEEYIKPAVEMDGGAIVFRSFDDTTGTLTVQLQGSCSGCPSSSMTLKAGIQNLFERMMPEVKEVVAENA